MRVEITPRDPPPGTIEGLQAAGCTDVQALTALIDGQHRYSVLLSRDPIPRVEGLRIVADLAPFDWRWHVSVAGERDVPRWRDLVAIAHRVRPGVCFVVGVPPRSWWLSVHPHCLHLFEVHDPNLTEQWRSERNGSVPS